MRPDCSSSILASSMSAHTTCVAEVGQAGAGGEADVAGADDRDRLIGPPPAHPAGSSATSCFTRRSRGTWWSSSRRDAAGAQGGVVEHRVGRPGRRPGRLQLGRGDRLHPVGVAARRPPDVPGEAGTRWSAPWLVTWKTPGSRAVGQPQDHGRQVLGEGRAAVLVVDEAQLRPVLGARRRTVLTMLAPWAPHTHDVRTIVAPGPSARTSRSPAELGAAVDRQRVGGVPLPVGSGAAPSKT